MICREREGSIKEHSHGRSWAGLCVWFYRSTEIFWWSHIVIFWGEKNWLFRPWSLHIHLPKQHKNRLVSIIQISELRFPLCQICIGIEFHFFSLTAKYTQSWSWVGKGDFLARKLSAPDWRTIVSTFRKTDKGKQRSRAGWTGAREEAAYPLAWYSPAGYGAETWPKHGMIQLRERENLGLKTGKTGKINVAVRIRIKTRVMMPTAASSADSVLCC